MQARLQRWPDLHIYHYAAYENTALKKLMSLHGTREQEVDDFLRQRRLVDLYRVVTEALVGLDRLLLHQEDRDVLSPGRAQRRSHERRRQRGLVRTLARDPGPAAARRHRALQTRDDCESTAELHAWLRRIRADTLEWRSVGAATPAEDDQPDERAPLDDGAGAGMHP